jgi:hypothetical protein
VKCFGNGEEARSAIEVLPPDAIHSIAFICFSSRALYNWNLEKNEAKDDGEVRENWRRKKMQYPSFSLLTSFI